VTALALSWPRQAACLGSFGARIARACCSFRALRDAPGGWAVGSAMDTLVPRRFGEL